MTTLSNLALKSLITGMCTTAGTVLILGVVWKIFQVSTQKTLNKVQKQLESLGDIDNDIDIIDLVDNTPKDFKKLFDF